jgi:hypothetical protein
MNIGNIVESGIRNPVVENPDLPVSAPVEQPQEERELVTVDR